MTAEPYLLDGPTERAWWPALRALSDALAGGDAGAALRHYATVTRALFAEGAGDLARALADAVLFGGGTWPSVVEERTSGEASSRDWSTGVVAAARADLAMFAGVVTRDWPGEVAAATTVVPPRWEHLAPAATGGGEAATEALARHLAAHAVDSAWEVVRDAADRCGAGPLARYEAYAWDGASLRGLMEPALADMGALVGLDEQLSRLVDNVSAFVDGRPALATLLYGPRGSGKSTAVRALLPLFRQRDLRLVEVPGDLVGSLPDVLAALRRRPHRHLVFLDDLAVDHDDTRLRPLKSLLDGSLRAPSERVLVIATSNRRHLVRERFADRPAAGDTDVHAWDTHNDRLALADRFGLTITFPGSDRRAYLAIVTSLAAAAGVHPEGLEERALRFASWGNGLSGRTARQFVDTLVRDDHGSSGDAASEPT